MDTPGVDFAGIAFYSRLVHLVVCTGIGTVVFEYPVLDETHGLGSGLLSGKRSTQGKQKSLFRQGKGRSAKMIKVIRFAMLMGATACLFSLFGCGKKHIQDGPGMVNDLNWKAFTLARSDSFAQYNFNFTVEQSDTGYLLTGECRDQEGNGYCLQEGMSLSADDIQYLRTLNLGNLPDAAPASPDEAGDLILLDAPTVALSVTYRDGEFQNKVMI